MTANEDTAREIVESIERCTEKRIAAALDDKDKEKGAAVYQAFKDAEARIAEAEARNSDCTTCGGVPPISGWPCICGGVNTIYAEIEGLRRECMERAIRLGEYPNISKGEIVEAGWTPTSENINCLPEPLRQWVMELETKCDPAGDLRRAVLAEDAAKQAEAWGAENIVAMIVSDLKRAGIEWSPLTGLVKDLVVQIEAWGRAVAALSDDEWMAHCEAASNQARVDVWKAGLEAGAVLADDLGLDECSGHYIAVRIRALIAPGGKP